MKLIRSILWHIKDSWKASSFVLGTLLLVYVGWNYGISLLLSTGAVPRLTFPKAALWACLVSPVLAWVWISLKRPRE